MKEISQLFNMLEISRYGATRWNNDTTQAKIIHLFDASSNAWELSVTQTYNDLYSELELEFLQKNDRDGAATTSQKQQFRNHVSTLNSFLATRGKTQDSRIGAELTVQFESAAREYLDAISVSPRTKRDRRSHLNRLKAVFDALRHDTQPFQSKEQSSLADALRLSLAHVGLSGKAFAEQAHVSRSAVNRYLNGAQPNARGLPGLRRMERHLGLERDALIKLIRNPQSESSKLGALVIPHRAKLGKTKQDTYSFKLEQMDDCFLTQWATFMEYKTTMSPRLKREARGQWRCIPDGPDGRYSKLVHIRGKYCPSASIALIHVRLFLGWLSRETTAGGWTQPMSEIQTIAWLAHPDAVNEYLEFVSARSEGLVHNTHKVFCRLVASLVRSESGYLWQSEEIRHTLPESKRPQTIEDWRTSCTETHKVAKNWLRQAHDIARAPDVPIAHLLRQEKPLATILEAIRSIECAASSKFPGGNEEAILRRDACLIALNLSNPLRLRTMQGLTYNSQNTGSVYRTPAGPWRIRLGRTDLKNGSSSAGNSYDVAIASWVTPILEKYLFEHRDVLLNGCQSKYLFVSSKKPQRPWSSMSQRMLKLTRRFVKGSPGFSCHAFRHLVATAWLRERPNAFHQVAELLNDRLATVMANYAHLQREEAFSLYDAYVESLESGLRRHD